MRPGLVLANADQPARRRWRDALERARFSIVAEVTNVDDLVSVTGEAVSAYLVGVGLPDNWMRAVASLVRDGGSEAVIVVDPSYSDANFLGALQAGAMGYVSNGDAHATPVAARAVLRGETWVPAALVERLVQDIRDCTGHRRFAINGSGSIELTMREWEVFSMMREGLMTWEIAEREFLSEATVRSHIATIAHKMGVQGRSEILRLAELDSPNPRPVVGVERFQHHGP